MVVDLRLSLQLRNEDKRRIRGVTLAVLTQQSAPGGKAWITVPTLDVAAGDVERYAAQGVHMVVTHVIGLVQLLDADESRVHESSSLP